MAGIKDVARAAGVSVSTVSYVLSGKRAISEKTSSKVMEAVRELRYTPDASAQKMRGRRNQILAVSEPIRGDINEAKYNAYFLHTAWQAKNAGYDVLLLTGEDAVDDIQRVTRSNMVDGVVLLDIVEDDDRVMQADSYGKPCVAIGYPANRGDCACVDVDFDAAATMAMDYLHERGHRTMALLRDNERDYARGSGYVVTLRQRMLDRAAGLGMRVVESGKNEAGSFDAAAFVRELMAIDPRPTAIVNQAGATVLNMVMQELVERGLDIPSDISVLSVGTFFENDLVVRPVTEIPLMPRLLCSKAVGLLVSAVEGGADIADAGEFVLPQVQEHGSVHAVDPDDEAGLDVPPPYSKTSLTESVA
ncbi:LacI family DNA-binding transcriptional regulator [Bifidobacterium platyrrhinorum]|uniref:LacI family DNA-binding transcriptional regulator n=1 Tax=Bifidobacterium platyrrhinorum TaxID=2661628 RepID=A0A6L9SVK5_9BIFI|nr:LacI family DNA-binding transcriptional regulator [Bifidobacterium platyrrhinorum]NEG55582.1 LacI family DNA-binding transcriptional regulator [Bifidobacterium platyrrhinorum]